MAVRGEDYIAVLDPVALKEVRCIQTASRPGMVLFRPDGRYAFVPSSFTPELVVIDTAGYKVVARIKQASPFSPNLAVSPDGKEVWFTLKDTGKTQLMSADPRFKIMATLDTGPVTNHVALVDNAKGSFAYVAVGGLNEVKVFRRNGAEPKLLTTISVGQMPHGIWPSGDGSRVDIGLENGDQVQAIDTETNKVIATIPVGQAPEALCLRAECCADGKWQGRTEATTGSDLSAGHLSRARDKVRSSAKGTVVIRTIGLIEHLQLTLTELKPDQEYDLILAERAAPPYGNTQTLTTVKTDSKGKASGQALGPIRKVVANPADAPKEDSGRQGTFILVQNGNTVAPPVLAEKRP